MKISASQIRIFQENLKQFYSRHSEYKPWKEDRNPYKIWLFEIVMQQTRLNQGIPFYERLVSSFPTLHHLAKAEEDEIFSVWKGLGYYIRARNLHYTAQYIVQHLDGKFPCQYEDLLKLKGVGEYTAAAIASFAFGENVAVLDGNVHRFIARYFGISRTIQSQVDKKYFQNIATQLLIRNASALYNQAMMDMGSILCKPQSPICQDCIFSNSCAAYQQNKVNEWPPKKIRPTLRDRFFFCLFLEYRDKLYLEKRLENDIWQGLYQGVMQEGKEIDRDFWTKRDIPVDDILWDDWHVQLLSHQRIHVKFATIKVKKRKEYMTELVDKLDIMKTPMPRVMVRYLEKTI